jgi:hypothetical protein
MKRSGMPRPTSCALSHVINVNKETETYEDTEPPPDTNILLVAVWPSLLLIWRLSILSLVVQQYSLLEH